MSQPSERPPIPFLIFFVAVLLAILAIGGTLLYRGLFMDTAPSPTLQEQLESVPAVRDVRTESHHIPGSEPAARSIESWVTLTEELTSDPELTAERLAEVSFGFQESHWSV